MENLPAAPGATAITKPSGIYFNVEMFEHMQRVGKMLASSSMVPEHFRGDVNIGNCMIALNLASRLDLDPFMVMQKMYVIHGKPGIESQLAIALINKSGRFTPIKWKLEGAGQKRVCTAYAKDLDSGEICEAECSMEVANAEGWTKKAGSKWKTMPDMMLRYRSAMFFARMYCPESLLGMAAKDELDDVYDAEKQSDGTYSVKEKSLNKIAALKQRMNENVPRETIEEAETVDAEITEPEMPDDDFPTDFNETMS